MNLAAPTWDGLLAVVVIALSTVLTRAGLLMSGERLMLSHGVEAALRFAPACALSALVLPEILYPTGALDLTLGNPRWPAAIAASMFLLWRHSITGAIGVGMLVYAVCRAIQG